MQVALRGPVPDLPEIEILSQSDDITIAEVPRYRIFTTLAQQIAQAGGQFVEIAGNDDILVSILTNRAWQSNADSKVISRLPRIGFEEDRILLATKVSALHLVFENLTPGTDQLEHIYDY